MIIVIFVMNDRQSKKDLSIYIVKNITKIGFFLNPHDKNDKNDTNHETLKNRAFHRSDDLSSKKKRFMTV
jgi:hypothetical protein